MESSAFYPQLTATVSSGAYTRESLNQTILQLQETANVLLDVVSFMEGSAVVWIDRLERLAVPDKDHPRGRVVHHNEHLRLGQVPSSNSYRDILGPGLVRAIPQAVGALRTHAPFLVAAIDAYLLGKKADSVQNQLLLFSTALEVLKSLHMRQSGQESLISSEHFEELCEALGQTLKASWQEQYGPKALRGTMKSKLRELNRPPYRQVLEDAVKAWNVDLRPIYGEEKPFLFIPFRDALVHTGQIADGDYRGFARETRRLRALVERFICALLGIEPEQHTRLGFP